MSVEYLFYGPLVTAVRSDNRNCVYQLRCLLVDPAMILRGERSSWGRRRHPLARV
jgi:hypothetical protein